MVAFTDQRVYTAQMPDTVETLRIRRLSQNSFRMLVPMAYMKNHDLKEGDHVMWIPDGDGVRLKFGSPSNHFVSAPTDEEAA